MSEEEEKRDSQADLTSLSQGESVLRVEGPESGIGTWAYLHEWQTSLRAHIVCVR